MIVTRARRLIFIVKNCICPYSEVLELELNNVNVDKIKVKEKLRALHLGFFQPTSKANK
jgi:hypothetical protein